VDFPVSAGGSGYDREKKGEKGGLREVFLLWKGRREGSPKERENEDAYFSRNWTRRGKEALRFRGGGEETVQREKARTLRGEGFRDLLSWKSGGEKEGKFCYSEWGGKGI